MITGLQNHAAVLKDHLAKAQNKMKTNADKTGGQWVCEVQPVLSLSRVIRDVNGMDINLYSFFFRYPGTISDIGSNIGYLNRISDSDTI
jgi:hypothetical protein